MIIFQGGKDNPFLEDEDYGSQMITGQGHNSVTGMVRIHSHSFLSSHRRAFHPGPSLLNFSSITSFWLYLISQNEYRNLFKNSPTMSLPGFAWLNLINICSFTLPTTSGRQGFHVISVLRAHSSTRCILGYRMLKHKLCLHWTTLNLGWWQKQVSSEFQ